MNFLVEGIFSTIKRCEIGFAFETRLLNGTSYDLSNSLPVPVRCPQAMLQQQCIAVIRFAATIKECCRLH